MAAKKQASAFEPDLSGFPPATIRVSRRYVCLACIFDIFTKQLNLAPRTAYTSVRGHEPSIGELTATPPARPYFDTEEERFPRCPYCESTKGKIARFNLIRLEASRATTAMRKALLDSLPKTEGHFSVIEEKASRRDLLFEWLADLGRRYDFDNDDWLLAAAQAYLEKQDAKTDWAGVFEGVKIVRRSTRLEEGYEREGYRLYLAPAAYDEILLVQYLLSRSHKAGGRTFEGRLVLTDLMKRLRRRGFLAEHDVHGEDPLTFLENLAGSLDAGGASTKIQFIVDRRDFLEKARTVYAKYAT